ncbi:Zinc finger protein [Nesidiocoris tenuis]|uniref:Zinc finger protein n=1 Tax=Nesidiocoris tenuis TaxID=355587 RepID=A0ABN7B2H1_9HEMI|nr:Zinc finger protein [Nesidiocoris tenuis]
MFGPLMFPTGSQPAAAGAVSNAEQKFSPCFLCKDVFLFPHEQEKCLAHIFEVHQLVIADSHLVTDLPKYLAYWKEKFSANKNDIKEFCTTILVDVKKDGVLMKDQNFFLLSDVVKEDKEIREKIKQDRLETVLQQQIAERDDYTYTHGCLFCRQDVGPTRAEYLTHLSTQHNLQLGRPEKIVFFDKFISVIEEKLEQLQCIFCEKLFTDRNVLKEHMRKKGHKRVDPNNQFYDQFYIVNYYEPERRWKEKPDKKERDEEEEEDESSDWSDWAETCDTPITCLFCESTLDQWSAIEEHMATVHQFDYSALTKDMDFYEQVKLVNYIRRQVHLNRCITCDESRDNNASLLEHMVVEKHLALPPKAMWDLPQYFFPTYENDSFLSQIQDAGFNSDDDMGARVCESKMDKASLDSVCT